MCVELAKKSAKTVLKQLNVRRKHPNYLEMRQDMINNLKDLSNPEEMIPFLTKHYADIAQVRDSLEMASLYLPMAIFIGNGVAGAAFGDNSVGTRAVAGSSVFLRNPYESQERILQISSARVYAAAENFDNIDQILAPLGTGSLQATLRAGEARYTVTSTLNPADSARLSQSVQSGSGAALDVRTGLLKAYTNQWTERAAREALAATFSPIMVAVTYISETR